MLVSRFWKATGISFGLDRISKLAKITISNNKVVLISIGKDKESIKISENLRDSGIACSLFFNKVSKALEYANSYSVPYVIFFGDEESKQQKVKLRDMKSGKESMLDLKNLVEKLKA